MLETVLFDTDKITPLWIDIANPEKKDIDTITKQYSLHEKLARDCMAPFHLPKLEKSGDSTFIIIRAYDDNCKKRENSVQGMTRKIALFLGDRFLISIHRTDQEFIRLIREQYKSKTVSGPVYLQSILIQILLAAVETYQKPIEAAEEQVHAFETSLFKKRGQKWGWEDIYHLKTRLLVIKRMLWHSLSTVQKFVPQAQENLPHSQELKERIENLQFFADSLLDDLDSLLNIQMSLASNSASEVMRLLTLFSVVFMPLTFIVGVYGMNFQYMPELSWKYGYAGVWGIMIAIIIAIYFWFRRQGWLK
jgi:magnesium transporter